MSLRFFALFWVAVPSSGGLLLLAQPHRSAYTFYGMGNPADRPLVAQVGMGGLGLAAFTDKQMNLSNPSWLSRNRYTQFHLAMAAEQRDLVVASGTPRRTRDANILYGAFGVPIKRKRWYAALSLFPYAHTAYGFSFVEPVSRGSVEAQHALRGEGGVEQLSLSNGLRLTEALHLGLIAHYLYGSVRREERILLRNSLSTSHYASHLREYAYGDFSFELSLGYVMALSGSGELMGGLAYKPATSLRVRESVLLENRSVFGYLLQNEVPAAEEINHLRHRLPTAWGFGLSYRRGEAFLAGLEGHWRQWRRDAPYGSDRHTSSLSLRMGARWVPDEGGLGSYFLRMPYRLGAGWETLPYAVDGGGQVVSDYYGTVGFSLPLRRRASLDVGLRFGYTGANHPDFLRERYVQYYLGTTWQAQWFLKGLFD